VKIDEGEQKIKIICTNRQSNLCSSCQSIFSLCQVGGGTTGELEGVFNGSPVLLSRLQELPAKGILEDMLKHWHALHHASPYMMLADVTEGDVKDTFK